MVKLLESSVISADKYPILSQWDDMVRRNYDMYQRLIDAKTYQLQRIQRYILSAEYPRKYDSDLVSLNLLKKKQRIGEVTSHQMQLYSTINPCIRKQFTKTFGCWFDIPYSGLAVGTGLFLYASLFNFSVPTRFMYFVVPIAVSYYWTRRSPRSEIQCSEFFDWVFQYRKAKAFNQRNKHLFNSAQTKKALGNANIAALGDQLIKLIG